MIAPASAIRARPPVWVMPTIAVLGCVALLMRSLSLRALVPTVAIGIAGMLIPTARAASVPRAGWLAVSALAIGAFSIVRHTADALPNGMRWQAIAATTIAALAEEAFFRRALFGWL